MIDTSLSSDITNLLAASFTVAAVVFIVQVSLNILAHLIEIRLLD